MHSLKIQTSDYEERVVFPSLKLIIPFAIKIDSEYMYSEHKVFVQTTRTGIATPTPSKIKENVHEIYYKPIPPEKMIAIYYNEVRVENIFYEQEPRFILSDCTKGNFPIKLV